MGTAPVASEVRSHTPSQAEIEFSKQFLDPAKANQASALRAEAGANGVGSVPEVATAGADSSGIKAASKTGLELKLEQFGAVTKYLNEVHGAFTLRTLDSTQKNQLDEASTLLGFATTNLSQLNDNRANGTEPSPGELNDAKYNLAKAFNAYLQFDRANHPQIMHGPDFEKHIAVVSPDPAQEIKERSSLLNEKERGVLNKDLAEQCKTAVDACKFIRERSAHVNIDGKVELLTSLAEPQLKAEALATNLNDKSYKVSDQEIRELNAASAEIAVTLGKFKEKDPNVKADGRDQTSDDKVIVLKYGQFDSNLKKDASEAAFSGAAARYNAEYEKLADPLNAISKHYDRNFLVRMTAEGPLWQKMVTMQQEYLHQDTPESRAKGVANQAFFRECSNVLSTKYENVGRPVEQLKDKEAAAKETDPDKLPVLSYADQVKLVTLVKEANQSAVALSLEVSAQEGGRSWARRHPAATETEGKMLTSGILDAGAEKSVISAAKKLADVTPESGVALAPYEAVVRFQSEQRERLGMDRSRGPGVDKTGELGLAEAILNLASSVWTKAVEVKTNVDLAKGASKSLAAPAPAEAQAQK